MSGLLKSANCGEKGSTFDVDHDGQKLTFRTVAGGWMGGYSDTLWYGGDHFSFCHHTEGLRAVVRFKPSSDQTYAGDLTEIELGRIYRHHCLKRRPKSKSLKPIIRSI